MPDSTSVAAARRVEVEPAQALVDERIAVRLAGFDPGQSVTVRAQMTDDSGRAWEARAKFVAAADGNVDVDAQAPLAGSYDSADAMGLIWSMRAVDGDETSRGFVKVRLTPTVVTLTAEVDGAVVATAEVERLWAAPGVTRTEIRDQGMIGAFYTPPGPGPHPTILLLGGSGGGLVGTDIRGALLASRGYAVYVLAYFALEHLPPELFEIPLEYFDTAIRWLQAHPAVDGERLGVAGFSKGGELSLLLAATFPELKAVAAYVPSGVVQAGIGKGSIELNITRSSWAYGGEPVPFAARRLLDEVKERMLRGDPVSMTPVYLTTLEDPKVIAEASTPVERIKGPILLISGTDDQMWPSSAFSDLVVEQLDRAGFPHEYRHLRYEGAGHGIGFPYVPTTVTAARHPVRGFITRGGGEPKATAAAQADSWAKVLEMFGRALGGNREGVN